MIDVLIFSRDRPAQLDLLLRSIRRHAEDVYHSIRVLFRADSAMTLAGYQELMDGAESLPMGWWRQDGSRAWFEDMTREWLDGAGPLVSFLVDDDVFYRDAPEPTAIPFSYRGGDYDYPFSLDGNVYERGSIVRLLDGLPFRNPTELEWFGHLHRRRLPFVEVTPCSPPCLVGLPYNRVSEASGMPHLGIDPAEMNARFLAGERLQIPEVAEGESLGVHRMMEPVWA